MGVISMKCCKYDRQDETLRATEGNDDKGAKLSNFYK